MTTNAPGPSVDPPIAWNPHRDSEARRESATAAAEMVLAARSRFYLPHVRVLLSQIIWLYTEADGKWNTRFRSRAAFGQPPSVLHHEHVVPRKLLIDRMLASPERAREIMQAAVACCVLRSEHALLNAVSPEVESWDRYLEAGIEVVDLASGRSLSAPSETIGRGRPA